MARGFGAAERTGFSKPRTFLGRITSEIQKAMGRIAELKNTGRSFDLDAALNALEVAQVKMQNYESRRRGFGAAEAREWNKEKFGVTDADAREKGRFGFEAFSRYSRAKMDEIYKAVNKPGQMRRPIAFAEAKKMLPPATAEDSRNGFRQVAADWKKEAEKGTFSKELSIDEAFAKVAELTNYILDQATSGNLDGPNQDRVEQRSADEFKALRAKGLSIENAGKIISMAQSAAAVRMERLDQMSKDIILKEAGFDTDRKKIDY